MKRALKIGGIVVGVLIVMVLLISIGYDEEEEQRPRMGATQCQRARRDFLTAQSVPGAKLVPCFTDEAAGWSLSTEEYSNDGSKFVWTTDKVKNVEWTISFTKGCQPASTQTVERADKSATVYEQTTDVPEEDDGTRRVQWMVFDGGCVVSSVVVPGRVDLQYTLDDVDQLLTLVSRSVLDRDVSDQSGGKLRLDPA